jgi:RNA polymerase sigma-70 factor (ECF subfamily)
MIGKLRAITRWKGGIDTMHGLESHIGNERHPAKHIHKQKAGELQDDAVQDALLSAYKHLDQFKATAKMTTWLTAIVTNSALTQLRRRPRHPHLSLDEPVVEDQDYSLAERLADVRPSPENECIKSELHGKLMQSVVELSPSLRKVIQLCDLDGLTTKEAAQILGLAQGTVKARVWRARTKLKRIVRRG